jgi:hypothetical protein
MALSPYSITVARVEVQVDALARDGQFTVDVKNEQTGLDRVVANIEAVATGGVAADPSWFAVDRHQRSIPAGGSEQFLVSATVSASTAPGSYLMRPVAYSADRPPDDTKVTGPIMTLVVPAPPAPPAPPWWRKWWPWWLIAAIAAVLLVVAVIVVALVLTGGSSSKDEAVSFNGPNQVITIPSSLPTTSQLTVQATITPTTGPPGDFGGIVRAAQGGGGGSWVLFTQPGRWGLSVCTPNCNAATAPLTLGQRHVVAGTYDGHTLAIFRDGVQVGSVPLSGPVSPFSSVQIGRWTFSFNGTINDVAVWNRALSPAELRSSAAHPPAGGQAGLVGLWRFDESSGQNVIDSSGSHHDGFLGDSPNPDPADPTRVPAG